MSFDHGDILRRALRPASPIPYLPGEELARRFADRFVLEGQLHAFDLQQFAEGGLCHVEPRQDVYCQTNTVWMGPGQGTQSRITTGWWHVGWQGHALEVVMLSWASTDCPQQWYWVIAESEAVARAFVDAVCAFCHEVRGEVLVFRDGYFSKSAELFRSIRGTRLADLVLEGDMVEAIERDFRGFLASRQEYERCGVPWKRGVLFVGPPGNGKTHCIKGLVNALELPCLYVQSFKAQYQTPHHNIEEAFARARKSAPCLLILEDLDALIDDDNRSYFLNQLDGFAKNTGIVTVATTNHPDRLDPAILDRPSRFDRKYHFPLPAVAERLRYAKAWRDKLEAELRADDEQLARLAERTDGFSFAYVKELFVSSMMRWIADGRTREFGAVLLSQIEPLRAQMRSE